MVGLEHIPWNKLQKQASKYGVNVGQPALAGGRGDLATLCITWVWTPTWWPWVAGRECYRMEVGMEEWEVWGRRPAFDSGLEREGPG